MKKKTTYKAIQATLGNMRADLTLGYFNAETDTGYYSGPFFLTGKAGGEIGNKDGFLGMLNLEITGLTMESPRGRKPKEGRDIALFAYHRYLVKSKGLGSLEADKRLSDIFKISDRNIKKIKSKQAAKGRTTLDLKSEDGCGFFAYIFATVRNAKFDGSTLSIHGDIWIWKPENTDVDGLHRNKIVNLSGTVDEKNKEALARYAKRHAVKMAKIP